MPEPKMNPEQFVEAAETLNEDLQFFVNHDEKDIAMSTHLQEPKYEELNRHLSIIAAKMGNYDFDTLTSTPYQDATDFAQAVVYLNSFIEDAEPDDRNDMDDIVLDHLKKLQNNAALQNVYDSMRLKIGYVNMHIKGYLQQEIDEKAKSLDISGVAPTVDECLNMSIYSDDADKIIDRMLWLSQHSTELMRIKSEEQNVNKPINNIYYDTYQRLIKELDEACPKEAMLYAEKINTLHMAVKQQCNKKLDEYKTQAPQGKDADKYAAAQLMKTDDYKKFMVVADLKTDVTLGHASNCIVYVCNEMPDFATKYGIEKEIPLDPNVDLDKAKASMEESGFDINPDLNSIIESYKELVDDQGKKSDSFMKMQNSLKEFLNLKHDGSVPEHEYGRKLLAAETAAQEYYESHKGFRFTDSGANRRDLSESITKCLKEYKKEAPLLKVRERKAAWKKVLFSKPGIKKEEKEFINKCLAGDDYHTRTQLFAYVARDIMQAQDLDSSKPENAQYKALMGKIGTSLDETMKKFNFEFDEPMKQELSKAIKELNKIALQKEAPYKETQKQVVL